MPNIDNGLLAKTDRTATTGHLIVHIKCEITKALYRPEQEDEKLATINAERVQRGQDPIPGSDSKAWLDSWGAKASLKVQVDEMAALSPSLAFNANLSNYVSTYSKGGNVTFARSFGMPLALTGSSKATRVETIGFQYKFSDLKKGKEDDWEGGYRAAYKLAPNAVIDKTTPAYRQVRSQSRDKFLQDACPYADGTYMEGDLKFGDFFKTNIDAASIPDNLAVKDGDSPFQTFTYEVSFVVAEGGSLSPSWKLYPVSVNQGTTLFAGSRTKTNDLILTLGDLKSDASKKALEDEHLASLIGRSVGDNLRRNP